MRSQPHPIQECAIAAAQVNYFQVTIIIPPELTMTTTDTHAVTGIRGQVNIRQSTGGRVSPSQYYLRLFHGQQNWLWATLDIKAQDTPFREGIYPITFLCRWAVLAFRFYQCIAFFIKLGQRFGSHLPGSIGQTSSAIFTKDHPWTVHVTTGWTL
jgi:hypothetical protein